MITTALNKWFYPNFEHFARNSLIEIDTICCTFINKPGTKANARIHDTKMIIAVINRYFVTHHPTESTANYEFSFAAAVAVGTLNKSPKSSPINCPSAHTHTQTHTHTRAQDVKSFSLYDFGFAGLSGWSAFTSYCTPRASPISQEIG